MTGSMLDDDRPRKLAPLSEQRPTWRPDWPLRVWLLPIGTMVAAAVVARVTVRSNGYFDVTVSPAAGYLLLAAGALAGALTYAFSESRWPSRPLFAALSAAFFCVATFLVGLVAVFI